MSQPNGCPVEKSCLADASDFCRLGARVMENLGLAPPDGYYVDCPGPDNVKITQQISVQHDFEGSRTRYRKVCHTSELQLSEDEILVATVSENDGTMTHYVADGDDAYIASVKFRHQLEQQK